MEIVQQLPPSITTVTIGFTWQHSIVGIRNHMSTRQSIVPIVDKIMQGGKAISKAKITDRWLKLAEIAPIT